MAMTAPPARRWASALIAPWSVLSRPLRYGSTGSSPRPVPKVLTRRVSNVLCRSCAPDAMAARRAGDRGRGRVPRVAGVVRPAAEVDWGPLALALVAQLVWLVVLVRLLGWPW